jgi:GxxExxY protein
MEILHKELSYAVMKLAFKVHGALGPGFPERVYHVALCHELQKAGIPFESEKPLRVEYDGVFCGEFVPDVVVDGKIILELKAVESLSKAHAAQALSYLRASGLRVAILMNFGAVSLQSQRIVC